MKKKPKITVLETGHILKDSPASGDRWLEKISQHLPPKYLFHLLVPEIGVRHWQESGLEVKYCLLPATPFDNQTNPIFIFLAYCLRAWSAFKLLKDLPSIEIVYSSADVLPDILPAYFFKKKHPEVTWMAQIHHLLPPPTTRPGNLLVNLASSLMQKISLFSLKDAADLILLNNSRLCSQLIKMNFDQKKLRVLGAGIEFAQISQAKIIAVTPCYHGVYLGRLHQTKGIFDLVPIWKRVVASMPEATLAVIGDGPSKIKNALKKQIQANGLEKRIKLLGFYVHGVKLFSLLKKAKLFLFTDHEAGWGVAVAEAMACQLPVIGYDIGVLGDVFQKGYLTIPCFNQNLFAQKIIFLLKNEKARKKLSLKAFSQAKQLDWQQTALKFSQILKKALKEKR